jgi:glucose/arabinose dehydrogenase
MRTPIFRRWLGFTALFVLLACAARAQHPTTQSVSGETSWPRVGFVEFLNGRTYIPSLGRTRGEAGDCFIDMRGAGDGSGRIFLVTRRGVIYIMQNGKFLSEPFLDISAKTTMAGERGLLSMAFPPDYKTKGHFYVYYTDTTGDVNIVRYKVDPTNPNRALDDSAETILRVTHRRYVNHNGGQLHFGRDGMLYFGIGDGGLGFDPDLNGQNLGILLGKMLRIDVEGPPDPGKAYHVPADNPFVKTPGALPEIWALGLRNPWRWCFDEANGDMYIANVGQNLWEQIYYAPGTSKGGENYGWSLYEGTHDLKPDQKMGTPYGITFPVAEFGHIDPPVFISITGGYVYRGKEFPGWQGIYFFSDWGNGGDFGQIWALRRDASGQWQTHQVDDNKSPIEKTDSFGTDDDGNLYALSFGDGKIYKLIELPAAK